MTTFNGIAVTDEINRYNQKFTLNAMYQSYTQQWSELLPCGINHNSEKDIGISKLTGIYIEPGKAYMTNSVSFADSKEEGEKILQHNYEYQYEHNVINHMDKYNALIDKIKGYIFGEYKLFWRNGVLVYNKGIVERLFPDLCANSQDGLLDIELLSPMVFVDENRKCSKCHSDYLNCDCISILDDGVVEIIEKGTPLGLVWTNRSAITA